MFIEMTKLWSKARKEFYIEQIINTKQSCFFWLTINFLKMLIDLAFLISTLSLFHQFMQYAKNILLKDFVLVGTGLVIEVDDGINSKFP